MENKLHEIACRTRHVLEDYVRAHPELEVHPARLETCCGFASWFLCRQIFRETGGYPVLVWGVFNYSSMGMTRGGDHCWVEMDGLNIDITLTQYAAWYRPVEIMSVDLAKEIGYKPRLRGSAAWEEICCWDPGPLLNGRSLVRFADRRDKHAVVAVGPRPRHYGAEVPRALLGESQGVQAGLRRVDGARARQVRR